MPFDPNAPSEPVGVMDAPPSQRGFNPDMPSELVAGPTTPSNAPKRQNVAKVGPPDWESLYGGLEGLDDRLTPDQKYAFSRLDSMYDNPKEARARAINQAYLTTQIKGMTPQSIGGNWDAVKKSYAKLVYGIDEEKFTDTALYGAIQRRMQDDAQIKRTGEAKPWTWRGAVTSDVYRTKKAVGSFVESISRPLKELPEAPDDLPNLAGLGMNNPAFMGAVWNGVKPLLEGLESPLGIGTFGIGTHLKVLSETYPAARATLAAMSGLFTAVMAKQTVESAGPDWAIATDENLPFQERTTAGVRMVANTAATLLGALGTAYEAIPPERLKPLATQLENKTPGQAAKILRAEAKAEPIGSDFLMTAAAELEKIAGPEQERATEGITAAAVRTEGGEVRQGPEHAAIPVKGEEGFTTTEGRFVDRKEAMQIAKDAGQVAPEDVEGKSALRSHMVDMPAKVTEPIPKDLIGIKNEVIDRELEAMGLPAAEHGETLAFKAALEKAGADIAKDRYAGARLVEDLFNNPRPATGEEVALLNTEMNRLRIDRDAAEAELIDAVRAGDADGEAGAKFKIAKARDDFARAADVVTYVGTKNAQGLALRNILLKEDYSLASMERRRIVAKGGQPLDAKDQAEVRELHQKLVETQRAFDEYRQLQADKERLAAEARAAMQVEAKPTLVKEPLVQKTLPANRVRDYLATQADAARERIKSRLTSGRVSSGIDPADVADYAIIGADYLARGVTKFAEWSTEMVKEFGESIRPHLQAIFDKAVEQQKDAQRLAAYKTRTAKAIETGKEKLATGDLSKPERRPIPLDAEAKRLMAENERVKRAIKLAEHREELKNRTPFDKVRDAFQGWVRFGALSYPSVVLKLTTAALGRFFVTPVEQAVGLGIGKIIPKEVTSKAKFEAVPTARSFIQSEVRAYTEGIREGLKGSADLLRNRETELSLLVKGEQYPSGLLDYMGKIHAALKEPAKQADFYRRLELASQWEAERGVNIKEPVEQLRIMHDAYQYAQRTVFLQDNGVVNAYKAGLRSLEAKQKATGKPSVALKLLSSGIQSELPIVKVPTNVVAEVSEYVTGILQGPARLAWAYAKGIDGLSYGEADIILRQIKKGAIGWAMLLLGYFQAERVGGFYQRGEKRKATEVPAMNIRMDLPVTGEVNVPKQLLDSPLFDVMQYGATFNRVSSQLIKKSGGNPKGPLRALLASTLGLVEEVPFVREIYDIGKVEDVKTLLSAADKKAAAILIPGAIQWTASQLDKPTPFSQFQPATPRKTENLKQEIMKGIPVFREQLPERKPTTRRR